MTTTTEHPIQIWHITRGRAERGHQRGYHGFATPEIDVGAMAWSRAEPVPALDIPIREIIDLLVETGAALAEDRAGYLAEALDGLAAAGQHPRPLLERSYAAIPQLFNRARLEFEARNELGSLDVLDGWVPTVGYDGRVTRVRAFPPRLVHVLAGNAPHLGAATVARGALTKGVHLLKLASNDLFTTPAVLRTMADVAPDHPVVRSFTAAYWRGGDASIERVLFRPQFFDKLVAWGGEGAIRSALSYIGPGFELVSFDPKSSISLIGSEAFASVDALEAAADAAATDAAVYNQEACVAARFQFVEGGTDDVDRFCEQLVRRLGVERPLSSARGAAVPAELREELQALGQLTSLYRVWGRPDGSGMVVRSSEPVDFHPSGKVVNVVPVESLSEAVRFVNVATQTVGVYPAERKAALRDQLVSGGVQRVVTLGRAGDPPAGFPHDGFIPLHRFVRWVNDEG